MDSDVVGGAFTELATGRGTLASDRPRRLRGHSGQRGRAPAPHGGSAVLISTVAKIGLQYEYSAPSVAISPPRVFVQFNVGIGT